MRTIKQTSQFKRDLQREAKGQHQATLEDDLLPVIEALAKDRPPDVLHRDHALTGNWVDHRDCHIKTDLVLLYRKPNDETLQLVRLGSHSELGL
ncbi:addiction module toxin, RelE/StbE family [Azotobacter vinelandii CA]|uniref:Addiction module toxin, RelE/StbE family n=2 Tax=Azotobacter vinelandii TaxID=354 RepID=C1DRW4_AZOVD|nr:type II toxin-antitoxin system YafQ family toxin [Azotobacter vinelandii]ACO79839.1 addiction module toxin, RelE/StbE family [Azotobacter vinelandii DJ]AGK13924.1 addiction module toxin, RelE/StbE family [Azotobacter vinelandii CA]AGK18648.1 addiction module toxin, RelE/StbE family [Azotobacter vinelandii CA6]SFX43521.1 mRNA interferase YafQ [Azotobacter vinelandii]GLK62351.1 addiction module toxin RelE [Azotobacter vinelandii]